MSGYRDVWLNQGVGNVKVFIVSFKQRLCDIAQQEWHQNIQNNLKKA